MPIFAIMTCAAALASEAADRLLRDEALRGWTSTESTHLDVHFPPDTVVADRRAWVDERERAFEEVARYFEPDLPDPIDVFVWNDDAQARPVVGRPLGFAQPDDLVIHTRPEQTSGHELTHIIVRAAVDVRTVTRFVNEGTAVAFDQSGRDRMAAARDAVRGAGARSISVVELWVHDDSPGELLYPVAGAFVDQLVREGGRERFLAFFEDQTPEHARRVYGDDFQRIVDAFEVDLISSPGATDVERLRAQARARMLQDAARFSEEQLGEIEELYGTRGSFTVDPRRAALRQVVERFPGSNRAGCALLYLARAAEGDEQEALLRQAIDRYGASWYGDGTQVGAYARTLLALRLARVGRMEEARRLAQEVVTEFPGAVDHTGQPLKAVLVAAGLAGS